MRQMLFGIACSLPFPYEGNRKTAKVGGEIPELQINLSMRSREELIMKRSNFEARIANMSKIHGFAVQFQELKFGYRRAVIACKSRTEFWNMWNTIKRMKNVWLDMWIASSRNAYEGYIYVMDVDDYRRLKAKMDQECQEVNDWWLRYHGADPETQRLMACGAIS